MSIYAVVLGEPNAKVKSLVAKVYPNHYELNETFFLVSSDGIAERVAQSVGIKGDERISDASGVVFRLNHAYSGYTSRSLWDWVESAEERGAE